MTKRILARMATHCGVALLELGSVRKRDFGARVAWPTDNSYKGNLNS
jgi:hypothetical protein